MINAIFSYLILGLAISCFKSRKIDRLAEQAPHKEFSIGFVKVIAWCVNIIFWPTLMAKSVYRKFSKNEKHAQ